MTSGAAHAAASERRVITTTWYSPGQTAAVSSGRGRAVRPCVEAAAVDPAAVGATHQSS